MNDAARCRLAERLRSEIEGDVLFDDFDRGRYATDASFYQVFPTGVAVPRTENDLLAIAAIAAEEGVAITARGGGTATAGQTVGEGLVVDVSKYLNKLVFHDIGAMTCAVQPGITLEALNRQLAPHGVWFPVDVASGSRATIGGMTATGASGPRALAYGTMRDNVTAIDAILADGSEAVFGELPETFPDPDAPGAFDDAVLTLLEMGEQHEEMIRRVFPALPGRVAGYNLDALLPDRQPHNLAELLIGSEGTLALSKRIELKLAPLPKNRVLGVCHFPSLQAAMEAVQHLVRLTPSAVELMDAALLDLAGSHRRLAPILSRFLRGEPAALLLVEFTGDVRMENIRKLKDLDELMAELGHRHAVVEAVGAEVQNVIWHVQRQALDMLTALKDAAKPVSFIEDCTVPLEHLPAFTEELTALLRRHGVHPMFYGHAGAGCLHVRPALNLKLARDIKAMRRIAEETFALVRRYGGSHSSGHGDGLVRSEFHGAMFGRRAARVFREVKALFDEDGRLNPGKITGAPRMDDRELFRYHPDYRVPDFDTALDWSGWTGAAGGFQGAVEMCDSNGACRKLAGGEMCPSFRVTRNERDSPRGRANTLRLAISGQLGPDALAAPEMQDTMKLCVSCKACRRECPAAVDVAKMKIEVLNAAQQRDGLCWRDRLTAYLPRYAPRVRRFWWALNARDVVPSLATLSDAALGFSAHRRLPQWSSRPFLSREPAGPADGAEVALLADTFNTWFEPGNLRAAVEVLAAAGRRVHVLHARDSERPLCCGRTFFAAGLVDEAHTEASRLLDAAEPFILRGVPVIGLEPACLFSLRDEYLQLGLGERARDLSRNAWLLEEYIARQLEAGRWDLSLSPIEAKAMIHGHCHQKAFGTMSALERTLSQVPGLEPQVIESGCCGMAGAFGYASENLDMSVDMAELALFPAIRRSGRDALLIANGFSCRHQIADGLGRSVHHLAIILNLARSAGGPHAKPQTRARRGPLRRNRMLDYFRADGANEPAPTAQADNRNKGAEQ
ncbi:MAG: FAD-binding and (Fe-S)-binding domain-containing protein [Dichotomicrobium sp.]